MLSYTLSKHRSGFTLVELLIVVAIIGILASILFPVFARAREQAKRSTCQSNLKQIGLGILQYTQDYDECYPLAVQGGLNDGRGWSVSVQPYLKSLSVYQCPTDRTAPGADKDDRGFTDYWYNAALSWNGSTVTPNYKRAIRSAALVFPSLTIMNGDGSGGSAHSRGSYRMNGCLNGGGYPDASNPSWSENDPGFTCLASGFITANGIGGSTIKHFDGHNLCFADGHVKWYPGIRQPTGAAIASNHIYNVLTDFSVSKQSPTFNVDGP